MKFDELRLANIERQREWDPNSVIRPLFFAIELAGEIGEACNVIKKIEREKMGIKGSRATAEDLSRELADIVIVADLLASKYGIDLGVAVVRKFNETSEKHGFATKLSNVPEK